MAGKVDCVKSLGPTCWSPDELKTVRLNVLIREVEKAVNNSVLLGNDFIDSCAFLKAAESEVVEEITDSSKCRFSEWQSKYM